MNKYIIEFIGTFFLVLVIGMTAVFAPGAGFMAPVAIGMGLAVLIYAGGPVSGAHYNPAVTVAAWLRGVCPEKDILPYIVAQLAGAVLAALVAPMIAKGGSDVMTIAIGPALLAEFFFTFLLVFVILNVATASAAKGNSYFGLAIGGTVTAGAYSVGNISGGAFNPAVALGLIVMGAVPLWSFWIYLIACFLGAVVAAIAFKHLVES